MLKTIATFILAALTPRAMVERRRQRQAARRDAVRQAAKARL